MFSRYIELIIIIIIIVYWYMIVNVPNDGVLQMIVHLCFMYVCAKHL